MTKGDLIEVARRRAASGDVPNDLMSRFNYSDIENLFNAAFMEIAASNHSILENMALAFEDIELSSNTLTLPSLPATGPTSVKYVVDACGKQYFGRTSIDQNVLLGISKPMVTPEFLVRGTTLTFTSTPGDGPYVVNMIPVFTSMNDDTGFIIAGAFQLTLVGRVVAMMRETRPQEVINNTSVDNAAKPPIFEDKGARG